MEIEIVTLSQQGGRTYNEDVHGHWHDERYVAGLVADGAGGHGGGDVVARQAEGGTLSAMRSTVVLVAIDLLDNQFAWAHSGDSRACLFRAGARVARTVDHSLVQQMVAGGMIDEEGARVHPQRNMLLSALGSLDEPPEIAVSAPMPLAAGDVLLLCSHGVWEPLGDDGIAETLRASRNPSQWVELLDQQIKACAKPGHDNYTVLVAWLHADGEATRLLPVAPR